MSDAQPTILWPDGSGVRTVADAPDGLGLDPVWALILLLVAIMAYFYWLPKTNVERDWSIRGGHYLGRLTPKLLLKIRKTENMRRLRKERSKAIRERGAYLAGRTPEASDPKPRADSTIRRS